MGLTSLIILIVVFVALIFLLAYSQIKTRRRKIERPFVYRSRQQLFTPTEAVFLYALDNAVGEYYRIFGKVRLADIVDTEVYRGVGDKAFSVIAYKHVDFLLCDKYDLSILCAVELDDRSHKSEKSRIRDAEKECALNSASIPLVRFNIESSYRLSSIRSQIQNKIGKDIHPQISRDLSCPKCGADIMARLAKAGVHKGKLFVGCSNYPECRFITE
jgi:hypothetical protein